MDEELVGWFDNGMAVPALLGRATFFVPVDGQPTRHDRMLVVDRLTRWAAAHDRVDDARRWFLAALQIAASDGDPATAYELVDAQLRVASAVGAALPLAAADLSEPLDHVDRYITQPTPELDSIRRHVRLSVPTSTSPTPSMERSATKSTARRRSPHTPPPLVAQLIGTLFGLALLVSVLWVVAEGGRVISDGSITTGGARRTALTLFVVPIATTWFALGSLKTTTGATLSQRVGRLWFWFLLLTIPNLFIASLYSAL